MNDDSEVANIKRMFSGYGDLAGKLEQAKQGFEDAVVSLHDNLAFSTPRATAAEGNRTLHTQKTSHSDREPFLPQGLCLEQLTIDVNTALLEAEPKHSPPPTSDDDSESLAVQEAWGALFDAQHLSRRIDAYHAATYQLICAQRAVLSSSTRRADRWRVLNLLLDALKASSSKDPDLRLLVDPRGAHFLRGARPLPKR